MDSVGDAPEIGHDDFSPVRPPLVSPEARALAGLVLVATSPFFGQVFQFLSFIVFERFGSGQSPALQYALYAGPVGGLAAVGAALGRQTVYDRASAPWARHVGGAAVVAGVVIALVVLVGIVVAVAFDRSSF